MIVKIVKIYPGLSLVLLWVLWGQFIFGQFLGLAYISQDLQALSYAVSTNDRVLIQCTCHFQGGSFFFSFFCLLVSSVSDFHPNTRGRWWTLFLGSLIQSRTEICMQVRKQQLELDMRQQTGSKQEKEFIKAVYCHPVYLTYMQSTS